MLNNESLLDQDVVFQIWGDGSDEELKEAYQEVSRLFTEETQERLLVLSHLNRKEIVFHAHVMCSSSMNIGAKLLSEKSRELENVALTISEVELKDKVLSLMELAKKTLEELNKGI